MSRRRLHRGAKMEFAGVRQAVKRGQLLDSPWVKRFNSAASSLTRARLRLTVRCTNDI
jgi:hypothetical protein